MVGEERELAYIQIDPNWTKGRFASAWRGQRKLAFKFFETEGGIQESSSVNYSDTDILGRAEAYKSYTNTSNKEIEMVFHFHAQGAGGGRVKDILMREVVNPAKWLDALKYPVMVGGVSSAPPPCLLVLGSLLSMRVLATAVSIQWMEPFDMDTMLPHHATVTCTFTAIHRQIKGYNLAPTFADNSSPRRFREGGV